MQGGIGAPTWSVAGQPPRALPGPAAGLGNWSVPSSFTTPPVGSSLLPTLLAASSARTRAVEAAFRDAGATSPAHAQPLTALPPLPPAALDRLVAAGRIREGAPGTFYLYAPSGGTAAARRRIVLTLVFWLAVMLIPLLLLEFTGAR